MIPLTGRSPAYRLPNGDPWFVLVLSRGGPEHQLIASNPSSAPVPVVEIVIAGAVPSGRTEYWVEMPAELSYLDVGDVVWLQPDRGEIRVLWRVASQQNFLLLTERCDNYCLMCSQPPKTRDDSWLMEQAHRVAALIPADANGVVLTGGEPTIYEEDLCELIAEFRRAAPECHVLILSNGRRFADASFAARFSAVADERVTVAIPVYGPEERTHDFVVQAAGAFQETIGGILNLAASGVRVEIRVVLHEQTVPVLTDLAQYILRNLPFVAHVALMGLELTGLTRVNMSDLWIDPYDYRHELADAVSLLSAGRVPVSVYNLPLCLLEPSVRRFAVQSISDWKNEYEPECATCAAANQCAGFFRSAQRRQSDHIRPLVHFDEALDAEGIDVPHDGGARVMIRRR